jgi:hypothetical protein
MSEAASIGTNLAILNINYDPTVLANPTLVADERYFDVSLLTSAQQAQFEMFAGILPLDDVKGLSMFAHAWVVTSKSNYGSLLLDAVHQAQQRPAVHGHGDNTINLFWSQGHYDGLIYIYIRFDVVQSAEVGTVANINFTSTVDIVGSGSAPVTDVIRNNGSVHIIQDIVTGDAPDGSIYVIEDDEDSETNIIVDGDNGDINVNLDDGDYEITVEDDRIIITIPDVDVDDVTVNFPSDWTYESVQVGDNVVVTITTIPVIEIAEKAVPLAGYQGIHVAYLIGFEDGTIRPRAEVTRAQVATIFFRLMSDQERASQWTQTNQFSDVVLSNWHNNAVSTATNAGIFTGMPDGSFQPNRTITRAELAATIVRYMGLAPNNGAAQFNDIEGHWAQGYINTAALQGWVMGDTGLGGAFDPNRAVTRAEAAAMINRAFDRLPESTEDLLSEMRTFTDNANPDAWFFLHIQEAANSHTFMMKDDGIHETWVELLAPEIRWELLERPDSRPDDVTVDVTSAEVSEETP